MRKTMSRPFVHPPASLEARFPAWTSGLDAQGLWQLLATPRSAARCGALRLGRLDLAVLGLSQRHKLVEQLRRSSRHGIHRALEGFGVRLRGLAEPADLPDVLERTGANLFIRRGRHRSCRACGCFDTCGERTLPHMLPAWTRAGRPSTVTERSWTGTRASAHSASPACSARNRPDRCSTATTPIEPRIQSRPSRGAKVPRGSWRWCWPSWASRVRDRAAWPMSTMPWGLAPRLAPCSRTCRDALAEAHGRGWRLVALSEQRTATSSTPRFAPIDVPSMERSWPRRSARTSRPTAIGTPFYESHRRRRIPSHVHVAQSPLSRHRPRRTSSASLRSGSTGSASGPIPLPTREQPDLSGLADALDERVPP